MRPYKLIRRMKPYKLIPLAFLLTLLTAFIVEPVLPELSIFLIRNFEFIMIGAVIFAVIAHGIQTAVSSHRRNRL